jgi:hypothetical protein
MIAEFPNPGCTQGAAPNLAAQMQQARAAILAVSPLPVQQMAAGGPPPAAALDPQTGLVQLSPMNGTVQITGVAFFDRDHGQQGNSPNVMELHPVLEFVKQ